jgi:hypothetical protein
MLPGMHPADGFRKPSGCALLRIGETHPAGRLPVPVQPRPLALAAVAVPAASPFGPRARWVRPSPLAHRWERTGVAPTVYRPAVSRWALSPPRARL